MTGFKVGDKGQRYEVQVKNEVGNMVTFGWADTKKDCKFLVKCIELHPAFHSPKVIDRQAK